MEEEVARGAYRKAWDLPWSFFSHCLAWLQSPTRRQRKRELTRQGHLLFVVREVCQLFREEGWVRCEGNEASFTIPCDAHALYPSYRRESSNCPEFGETKTQSRQCVDDQPTDQDTIVIKADGSERICDLNAAFRGVFICVLFFHIARCAVRCWNPLISKRNFGKFKFPLWEIQYQRYIKNIIELSLEVRT